MITLVLALMAEGPTDERFLPIIIQRTAEKILRERSRFVVDVLEPIDLRKEIRPGTYKNQAERILLAAQHAAGYHALIVHVDADDRTHHDAIYERIQPGFDLVKASKEDVCRQLIPIIPIRMTEAWMLADPEAFKEVVGTDVPTRNLGLPARPHQVEAELDPKHQLRQAIKLASASRPRRRRRRGIRLGHLYEPLARQIRLERLSAVPAYQRFVDDLTACLIALRLAE